MKNLKILLVLSLPFFFESCATRGFELGQQIPEYHEAYNPAEMQIYAEGGQKDAVVYVGNRKENLRSLRKEYVSIDHSNLSPEAAEKLYSGLGGRSIASIQGLNPQFEKAQYIKIAPDLMYETSLQEKKLSKIILSSSMTLKEVSKKYLGNSNRWREIVMMNPELFKIKKGTQLKIVK